MEIGEATWAKAQKGENSEFSGPEAGCSPKSTVGMERLEAGRLDQRQRPAFERNIKHFILTKCFVWDSSPPLIWGYCFRYTLKEFVNGAGKSLEQQCEGRGGNAVNILSVCFSLARNLLFS